MKQSSEPPSSTADYVARPISVWDCRAPFSEFADRHRAENRIYYGLLLARRESVRSWQAKKAMGISVRDFYPDSVRGARKVFVDREAGGFCDSFRRDEHGKSPRIEMAEVIKAVDHNDCESAVTEYAVTSEIDLFESYLQCWALNWLLSKLETGIPWTQAERDLAQLFNEVEESDAEADASHFDPVAPIDGDLDAKPPSNRNPKGKKSRPLVPSMIGILNRIDDARNILNVQPHVRRQKRPLLEGADARGLTSLETILFWKEWRNLLVHAGGIVPEVFYYKYRSFWERFKACFEHVGDFYPGERLSMKVATFKAVASAFFMAAEHLKDLLTDKSVEGHRRGHMHAPRPVDRRKYKPLEAQAKEYGRLLIEGDHPRSYKYAVDHQDVRLAHWAHKTRHRRKMERMQA